MTRFEKGQTIQFDWSDGIVDGGILGFYQVEKDFSDDDVLAEYDGTERASAFIEFLVESGYVKELTPDHVWCPEERGILYEC